MGKYIDLTGQRFGRLTVLSRTENKGTKSIWLCRCDCGNEKYISTHNLTAGRTTSCGCKRNRKFVGERYERLLVTGIAYIKDGRKFLRCKCDCGKDVVINSANWGTTTKSCGCWQKEKYRTHGLRFTRLNAVWNSIKQRCTNPKNTSYKDYGGRGIKVCDEWLDFQNFHDWAFANGYDENAPQGKCTLDRIDFNGNYCPENCRWVDMTAQMNNTRRNVFYEYNGERLSLTQLAQKYNIKIPTLFHRINRGMSISEAIETPIKDCGR